MMQAAFCTTCPPCPPRRMPPFLTLSMNQAGIGLGPFPFGGKVGMGACGAGKKARFANQAVLAPAAIA